MKYIRFRHRDHKELNLNRVFNFPDSLKIKFLPLIYFIIFVQDAFVLCRVTKRNGWGLGGYNVSPQSDNVQSEKVDDCSEQPQVVASSAAPEKSSSPSESAEDIEAWFANLFDPDFSGEVKSEPEVFYKLL